MIGAIIAGSLSAPTAPATNSWESIATFTVGSGGSSSIVFGSGGTIPQTYKHLQIRHIARGTSSNTLDNMQMQYNGDTAGNYISHFLYGTGSGSGAAGATAANNSFMLSSRISAANTGASMFGSGVIDILDYANTSKNKTMRSLSGWDGNGSGEVFLESGLWMSTSAVTSITLYPNSGNFAQYSSFALYGIKG